MKCYFNNKWSVNPKHESRLLTLYLLLIISSIEEFEAGKFKDLKVLCNKKRYNADTIK